MFRLARSNHYGEEFVMYIKNGIAYADDQTPQIRVRVVRVMPDYHLWLQFNNDEIKIVDFSTMLDYPAFMPLRDQAVFAGAYVDYGTVVWNDGDIDISPDYLYKNGVQVSA